MKQYLKEFLDIVDSVFLNDDGTLKVLHPYVYKFIHYKIEQSDIVKCKIINTKIDVMRSCIVGNTTIRDSVISNNVFVNDSNVGNSNVKSVNAISIFDTLVLDSNIESSNANFMSSRIKNCTIKGKHILVKDSVLTNVNIDASNMEEQLVIANIHIKRDTPIYIKSKEDLVKVITQNIPPLANNDNYALYQVETESETSAICDLYGIVLDPFEDIEGCNYIVFFKNEDAPRKYFTNLTKLTYSIFKMFNTRYMFEGFVETKYEDGFQSSDWNVFMQSNSVILDILPHFRDSEVIKDFFRDYKIVGKRYPILEVTQDNKLLLAKGNTADITSTNSFTNFLHKSLSLDIKSVIFVAILEYISKDAVMHIESLFKTALKETFNCYKKFNIRNPFDTIIDDDGTLTYAYKYMLTNSFFALEHSEVYNLFSNIEYKTMITLPDDSVITEYNGNKLYKKDLYEIQMKELDGAFDIIAQLKTELQDTYLEYYKHVIYAKCIDTIETKDRNGYYFEISNNGVHYKLFSDGTRLFNSNLGTLFEHVVGFDINGRLSEEELKDLYPLLNETILNVE